MDDIAPELLEQINKVFSENMAKSEPLAGLLATIQNGSISYADAQAYADLLGGCLADALGALNSDVLPDGRLYYNIAERLLTPLLEKTYTLASDAAVAVQTAINTNAGIDIKAQRALFDTDRAKGIIDKVSDAPIFDDVKWVLREPLSNFTMASVDNTLKANIDFQGKAGLSPRIIRKAEFKCCAWCKKLEGIYSYPDLPREVYQRHERCRCTVEYDPGTGKRQRVHTKKKLSPEEIEIRAKRISSSQKEHLPNQSAVEYNKDGTIKVTHDWTQKKHPTVPLEFVKNAVLDVKATSGHGDFQINRTIYDNKGLMSIQIHGGDHGFPANHCFGVDGTEPYHKHIFTNVSKGGKPNIEDVSLSDEDKIAHRDISKRKVL